MFVFDINNFTPEYVDLLVANENAAQLIHDKAQRLVFYLNALQSWRDDSWQRAANGLPPLPKPTPPDGLIPPPDPTAPPPAMPPIPPGQMRIGVKNGTGLYDAIGDNSPIGTIGTASDGVRVRRVQLLTPFGWAQGWEPVVAALMPGGQQA